MSIGQEILDLPRALRGTLEKNRCQHEALIRQTRWGDGPIFVLTSDTSLPVGVSACCAFEDLPCWPAMLRHPARFASYSLAVLRPGSVVMALDLSGDNAALLEATQAAQKRGAQILVATNHPSSALAKMADGVFAVHAPGDTGGEPTLVEDAICAQAAVHYIAWLAAKILKRPRTEIDALEEEFAALPQNIEWMLGQLRDAARSLGSAVARAGSLYVGGEGYYRGAAVQWAQSIDRLRGIKAECLGPFESRTGARRPKDAAAVLISGSRCRMKKQMHELARQLRIEGVTILSVTDGNDRELAERSELAVLLPVLAEATGSILALALLEWAISETGRADAVRTHTPDVRSRGAKSRSSSSRLG